jgi:TonB-linked SusC/RagA family outer membrane protein
MKKSSLTILSHVESMKTLWRIIKLTLVISLCFVMTAVANSYSQAARLNLKLSNVMVKDVLSRIEKESDFVFLYNVDKFDENRKVSVDMDDATINKILDAVLKDQNLKYDIYDRQIIISSKKPNGQMQGSVQQKTISGKVTDTSGDPIPGVTVVIKGTSMGTTTDIDGQYNLPNVPVGSTLVFSFVGMKTQEIPLQGQSVINVKMAEETMGLEEVVVVGYGTMKKSDLTGAITQVKIDDLVAVSGSNPIQALQGRASGVSVMTSNEPGSSPALRIRGTGSIDASNEPLYVVDGFPLMDGDLNNVNSADIESMEILKDASSTAIYGSRGANGVILITTKSGSKGKNELSFSSYYGIQMPGRYQDFVQRDDFISFINEAYSYSGANPVYATSASDVSTYGINYAPEGVDTNWEKQIIKDSAPVQDYTLSFSGGNESTSYMLSGGVYMQDGLINASGFDRYNVRVNLDHKFNKWLTVGTHTQASRLEKENRDNATGNIPRWGWPTTPVKNADGSWYYAMLDPQVSAYMESVWNPVSDGKEITDETSTDRLTGDVYAQISPVKHVKLKTNFGVDISNAKNYNYSTSHAAANVKNGTGSGGQSYFRQTTKLTESILTYSNIWNEIHRLTATGVYSYQDYQYENLAIDGSGFTNDATGANDMTLADTKSIKYSSNKYSNKLVSFTGRIAYTYKDKYNFTATGRYDGSSRFGENKKWGFFPSAGVSWRVDQENFMNSFKDQVTNLKLRASYGITGNQEIGNYNSLALMSPSYYIYNDTPILGFKESIGNPDLKWEKTAQLDLGIDLSLFNWVDLTVDYYSRKTTDLLYNVPIPTTSGYSSMLENIGEVNNHGWEISVHSKIIDNKNFKWDISGNLSMNNNEISKLYGDVTEINLGTSSCGLAKYLKVGDPVTAIYGRESGGIITTEEQLAKARLYNPSANYGEELYIDKDNSNSINSYDFVYIGSIVPEFYYGLSTNMEYKNFRLDLYGQGAHNYASMTSMEQSNFGDYAIGYSSPTGGISGYYIYGENQLQNRIYMPTQYAYDRMWREGVNENGSFPRPGARGVYASKRTNGNWNYFLLKNVKLSYQFDRSIVKWAKNLTLYVNLQNFANEANHRGYNPENGDDSYAWAKAVIFGINAKF